MATKTKQVRTRFAPSPTGFVHIGSLRTALFSFLFARHHGGVNVLRIEDTDQTRKVEGAVENMLRVMGMCGVEFDEGFQLAEDGSLQERGDYGPYLQSNRLELYQQHVQQLLDQKKAYYCFCSAERLEELRKEQTALKKPPMYDRHCRALEAEAVEQQLAEFKAVGKQPVVRQAIPLDGTTTIHDLVYGDISYDHRILDDQVLLKSDGFPTYHLAVVVDDHLMEITHVIRGEEWIPSTPKHLLLYEAFGWEAPQFAHMPLILNPDKSKLSKRQGDVAVEDFLAKGYLKEALVNFVVFLGWNPKTEQEVFTMDELITQFDLAKVHKAGAILDMHKLDWMNGLYIRSKSTSVLVDLLLPYWQQAGIDTTAYSRDYLEAVANLEKDRLKKLSEIIGRTEYCFADPEYDAQLLVWKKADSTDAKAKLGLLKDLFTELADSDFTTTTLEERLKSFITSQNFDTGSVLWPLRVALTGLEKSPGPFEVAATLHRGWGKETIVRRIEKALILLQ